jgi:hypothetical protein
VVSEAQAVALMGNVINGLVRERQMPYRWGVMPRPVRRSSSRPAQQAAG